VARNKTIEKTKLIKLLSTFSTLEWKRFGRYVQSPFHNTNQSLIQLYKILKKAIPVENVKDLEEARVYKKLYGVEVMNISKFRNACSDLYQLATDFLVEIYLDREKEKKKKLLIEALSERNYELFKGVSLQLIKEIENQEVYLDNDDFLLLYQLNYDLYHHIEKDKYNSQEEDLKKSWKNLNDFYEYIQLQLELEVINRQNYLNQKDIIEQANKVPLKELFEAVKNLYKEKETSAYFQLKEKIYQHWGHLKKKHRINLFLHLINFSFTNVLIQKEFGYTEAMTLYKRGLKEKLWVVNGKMRDIEFLNISMIGFKLEPNDWVVNFIETHEQYLLEEVRDFLVPLVYAYRANFEKDYEQVIYLLREVVPRNNPIYLERIKKLLIRAYFEGLLAGKEEYNSLLTYELDSIKKLITRSNRLSDLKKDANLNFLYLFKKLMNISTMKDLNLNEIEEFETLLNETRPLTLKHWLQEKVLEIKEA
jgi:hypothetical protein